MRSDITLARVKQLYDYDAATGNLLYKIRLSPRVNIGDVVGGNKKYYRYAKVDGVSLPIHHLVWFWHHGIWPAADLSFRDGCAWNTCIDNLGAQTKSETANKFKGLRSSNTTGVKGVSLTKEGKYQAHIYGPGGSRALGRHFKTLDEAAAAIERAKAEGLELRADTPEAEVWSDVAFQARRTWRKLQFATGGSHDWTDGNALFAEVGFAPSRRHILVAIDSARRIGPKNTKWQLPEQEQPSPYRSQSGKGADYYLNKKLLKKFGITLEAYQAKLKEQDGLCAICFEPEVRTTRKNKDRLLSVDHNHRTGAIRGLLCRGCNVAIGFLKENTETLQAAITYIDKWNTISCDPLPDNVVSLSNHKKST